MEGGRGSGIDVVGGTGTSIEQWPWQAAIVTPEASGGSAYERQRCGGVLVSRTAVVTAAATALFILVLSLNLLGDALRRAFDPKRG